MELSGISTTSTKYGIGTAYSSTPAGAYALTVEAGSTSGTYSFKCPNGQYLYWTSDNSLATNATKSANTSWKITFSGGNATILNANDNTRKLQWNASSPRFACYTSSQTAVQLYKKAVSEYNITYTGDDHITYSGTKPETIKKEDSGFELEFSVNDGYKLNNVQVKMGGQNLVLDDDYLWEEGYLLILPGTDITGDIEIIFETVATCTNPTITTQPTGATYTKGATATPLKVVASGTNLTYQWYSNTSNSTSGATKINDATNSTYTPSISTAGTKYYYCIVSSGSCSTPSNIVSVVVKNPTYTVIWKSNGVEIRTDNNVESGTNKTAPTISPIPCGDVIAGWTDAENYVHGTSALYSGATPSIQITDNKTFYAVFADYAN